MRFKAHAGMVLWAEGEVCRRCESPLTHFVIRPIEPEYWQPRGKMSIVATPYCNTCSPAIDQESLLPNEAAPDPAIALPARVSWFERWVTRWILTTQAEREKSHA